MTKLSVVVVTYNEEKNIGRSLASVRWADEIIIVDSYSSDRTISLARNFTERIYQFEYPGYSRQVERGIQLADNEWIFILDADEEVSPDLADAIRKTIQDSNALDGYYVNRKVFAFGKWIEHSGWFPDWQFRLLRRNRYIAEHHEIHGAFKARGTSGRLDCLLYHYTYDSISQYLKKMNVYTSLQVSNRLKENPKVKVGWMKILFSPSSHFFRLYCARKGYRDGIQGFLLASLDALYSLAFQSKLWEYRLRWEEKEGLLPPITNAELERFKNL